MNHIEELCEAIRLLHPVESKHVTSVAIKDELEGKTVWQGIVKVFELIGHPKAPRIYGWAHDADDPKQPRRRVTVLHAPPLISLLLAVRVATVQEARENVATEES